MQTQWTVKTDSNRTHQPGDDETIRFDFEFDFDNYPNYVNQSKYSYPNKNFALFGENIFYLNENLSITPGFRYENIVTKNIGFYRRINTDAAGNVIYNERFDENESRKRSFLLLGLGIGYKVNIDLDLYSNFSQNYRSVTFADISIILSLIHI